MKRIIALSLVAINLTGCAGMLLLNEDYKIGELEKHASFDLACPIESLTFTNISNNTMGVSGCNKKARYIFICESLSCTPVNNTNSSNSSVILEQMKRKKDSLNNSASHHQIMNY